MAWSSLKAEFPRLFCLDGFHSFVLVLGLNSNGGDVVKKDLQQANNSMTTWYDEAQHRGKWYEEWNESIEQFQLSNQCMPVKEDECVVCRRTFRRESDKARHKCVSERKKPVYQQTGAIQYRNCERWFKSKGGLKYTSTGQAQQCDV